MDTDKGPKDKREETLSLIKKLKHQNVDLFETRRIAKDGRQVNVSLTVTRLVDDDGKPAAIVTTERDNTMCR